ncbi:hypothetical protein [Methylobacterium sp. Gmos1]
MRALRNVAAMAVLGAFAVSLLRSRRRLTSCPGPTAWGYAISSTVH